MAESAALPLPPPGGHGPFDFSNPVGLAFDPIDTLPGRARTLLRRLRIRAADLHAIMPKFEEVRESSMRRIESQNVLTRLTAHSMDGGFGLKDDARQVTEARRALEKATIEFEDIQRRQTERSAAWRSATQATANVETWLKSGRPPGTQLEDVDVPVKLAKGESNWVEAVANHARRSRTIIADLHRVRSAPLPAAVAREMMRAEIETLSVEGAPDVSAVVERGARITWPLVRLQSEVYGAERALAVAQTPNVLALMCFLFKNEIATSLDRLIAEESDEEAALSPEVRQERESELLSDLLAQEMIEAACVWKVIEAQAPIEFRADIDPKAVLQVRLVTSRAANAGDNAGVRLRYPDAGAVSFAHGRSAYPPGSRHCAKRREGLSSSSGPRATNTRPAPARKVPAFSTARPGPHASPRAGVCGPPWQGRAIGSKPQPSRHTSRSSYKLLFINVFSCWRTGNFCLSAPVLSWLNRGTGIPARNPGATE